MGAGKLCQVTPRLVHLLVMSTLCERERPSHWIVRHRPLPSKPPRKPCSPSELKKFKSLAGKVPTEKLVKMFGRTSGAIARIAQYESLFAGAQEDRAEIDVMPYGRSITPFSVGDSQSYCRRPAIASLGPCQPWEYHQSLTPAFTSLFKRSLCMRQHCKHCIVRHAPQAVGRTHSRRLTQISDRRHLLHKALSDSI